MWPSSRAALLLLVGYGGPGVVDAKLVAGAVLPHGDFAYDPTLLLDPGARRLADRLQAGSATVGRLLAAAQPDVVVLSTPHGLQDDWDLVVYQNDHLNGVATVGRDLEASCS